MKKIYLFVLLSSLCFLSFETQATVIFVDHSSTGTNTGSSWANAYTTLQPALNAASAGDSIWIAAGTYKPTLRPNTGTAGTNTTEMRDQSFYLNKDIEIYGGFANTGSPSWGSRNSSSNPVILSGDIGTQNDITDNCYHVFITDGLSSAAVLDGVTITGGNADVSSNTMSYSNYSFERDCGGGLYVAILSGYTSPTLKDVIINYNYAAFGGGMYNSKSSASLDRVNMHNNTATASGGGMYNYDSPLTMSGVTIENNSCASSGGGMNNQSSDTITMTETVIMGNTAAKGGGIFNDSSSIVFLGVLVSNNVAYSASSTTDGFGGGIVNSSNSITDMTAVIIIGNTASNYGGGIMNTGTSTTTLTNVIISGNSSNSGGGITNNGSSLTITNSSIYGNAATSAGGGLINIGTPTITNTIFWGNTQGGSASVAGADIYTVSGTVTITYSLTQENSSYSTGTGMINNQDPLFINKSDQDGADNGWITADDGLNICDYSPAYQTGTSSGAPTTDITGTTRGLSPSMGAYEGIITSVHYVKTTASGTGDGSSWTNATTLQAAINASSAGDRIFVTAGTYYPTGYPAGVTSKDTRDYAFYLNKDIKIYGGFANTGTPSWGSRNSSSNPVILSGNINVGGTATNDCYHVFITEGLSSAAVLDGVTITGGNADGSSAITYSGQTYDRANGGGMYNYSSSSTLANVTISGNNATYVGGGMANNVSSPILTNVTISGNTASYGGGIINSGGSPILTNVTISGNTASTDGGGMYNDVSSLILTNVTISGNTASSNGGGMYNDVSSPTITNTIFWENIKGTTATNVAGADIYTASGTVTITYSLTQENSSYSSGTGMINNQDPLFINASDPDGADDLWMTGDDGLVLSSTSSGIGAGTSSSAPEHDITNKVRPTTPSIGAYEGKICKLSNNLPTVPATYTSSFSSVDGSYTCYCDDNQNLILALNLTSTGAVVPTTGVSLEIGSSTTTSWTNSGGIITNSSGGSIINRKWNVAPTTQPTSDVTVIYPFTNTEYSAIVTALSSLSTTVTNPNQLQMYKLTSSGTFADPHASGATGVILPNGSSASATEWVWSQHGNGTDHLATYKVSSFSGGGGGGGAGGAPLPVELVYFEAKAIDNHQALLNWQTASEVNNNYFDVERSYDAIHWEWVGKVAGNGTTTQFSDYNFVDKTIGKSQQTAYYRLNQIDYDGAHEYTDIRPVRFDGRAEAFEIAAYPNPFSQEVTIRIRTTELYSIEVTDINGLVMLNIENEDKGTHRLDLSTWASGVYIVNVTSTQGTKHLKVMKQ